MMTKFAYNRTEEKDVMKIQQSGVTVSRTKCRRKEKLHTIKEQIKNSEGFSIFRKSDWDFSENILEPEGINTVLRYVIGHKFQYKLEVKGYKQIQKSGRPLRECVSGVRLDVRNTVNIFKN